MMATVLGFSFLYTLSADFLLLEPTRRCMHFLGGPGSELYHFTRRAEGQAPEHRAPLEPKDWALRRVRAETAMAGFRQPRSTLASKSAFAGGSRADAHRLRTLARRALREASLQGQERRETVAERSEREARWAEREKMKQREHEQEPS
eukprot:s769_g13.t1